MRQACSKPVVGLHTSLTATKTSLQTIRLRINLHTAIVSKIWVCVHVYRRGKLGANNRFADPFTREEILGQKCHFAKVCEQGCTIHFAATDR